MRLKCTNNSNYVQNQKHIEIVFKQYSECTRFRMDIWLAGCACKYNYSCPSVGWNSVTPHYDIQLTPMGGGTFPLTPTPCNNPTFF